MSKVLIIESDAPVARALADALGASGIESQITADGTEGLTLAKSETPVLIVLCVELSRVSGYSICNKLKKDPELGRIPLILTSSQATEETFEQHKKLKTRAEAYLKKPYSDAEIMRLVSQYVGGVGGSSSDDVEVSLDDVSVEIDGIEKGSELDFSVEADDPAPAMFDAPAAKPAPVARPAPVRAAFDETLMDVAPTARTAATPRPTLTGVGSNSVSDAASEQLRNENRQLRQKVQKLEQTLEQKEIEFNDRLLQESARSREGVELKKKLTTIERDIAKHQQAADKGKTDAAAAVQEAERLRQEIKAAEGERQAMAEKMGQLVDKVKSLAAERDGIAQEVERLTQAQDAAARDLETAQKMREKAKKAVDIATQLIEETGLLQ